MFKVSKNPFITSFNLNSLNGHFIKVKVNLEREISRKKKRSLNLKNN